MFGKYLCFPNVFLSKSILVLPMLTPSILRTYRRRLTNLSSRNRSLLLTNLPSEQFLDLHEADFLLNKPSFDILAQLITSKRPIALCDVLDPR